MAARATGRKKARAGGRSRTRSALVWGARLLVAAIGVVLVVEAWRFPAIAAVVTAIPERTALMREREAEARRAGKNYRIDHRPVPLGRIAPSLQRAVIAAEDARFYEHRGFDAEAIREAIEDHLNTGERLRGASTISQQLVKNLWLGSDRSWLRKGREAVYTYVLERRVPKDRILELYLNVVEWGPGIFGAEAASRRYFGRAASDLDPEQAARLAAVLPSPLRWSVEKPSPRVENRARRIARRAGAASRPAAAGERVKSPAPAATPAATTPVPPPGTPPRDLLRATPGKDAEAGPTGTPVDMLR